MSTTEKYHCSWRQARRICFAHALDVFAEFPCLADGVHHLPEQVFIGEAFDIAAGEAGAIFGLEFINFPSGDQPPAGAVARSRVAAPKFILSRWGVHCADL
jgi:hypothetical protein